MTDTLNAAGIVAELRTLRTAGHVRGGAMDQGFETPEAAARAFGLAGEPGLYGEIDASQAVSLLQRVIHRDLAYGVELVSPARAQGLAIAFVQAAGGHGARYFTNGTLGTANASAAQGVSWSPATDATFDTGILVIMPQRSACLWFEDED